MISHVPERFRRRLVLPLACCTLFSMNTSAFVFRTDDVGELRGIFDLEVAYGVRVRTDDQEHNIVANQSGGSNLTLALLDDGNLNYDKGDLISNMVRGTAELTLQLGNVGFFARGYAFYDYENDQNDRARLPLESKAKTEVVRDQKLQDIYLSLNFDMGDIPVQLRVGEQVLNWGESLFFGPSRGVNVINPVNIPLFQQPTSTLRDLRVPVGMLWGSAQITPLISVEAYWNYDWEHTVIPARGTYFASGDLTPGAERGQYTGGPFGGATTAPYGNAAGATSDLGTDVCQRFSGLFGTPGEAGALAAAEAYLNQDFTQGGTMPSREVWNRQLANNAEGMACFDRNFLNSPMVEEPGNASDDNQYGVTIQGIIPQWNDTKIALHYARYNSHIPFVSGTQAGKAVRDSLRPVTVDDNSGQVDQNATNTGLVARAKDIIAAGGDPGRAAQAAFDLAFAYGVNDYALSFNHPEDIHMVGLSFNTTTIHTGTAFSGEIAHHIDAPVMIHLGEYVPTLLDFPLGPAGTPVTDNAGTTLSTGAHVDTSTSGVKAWEANGSFDSWRLKDITFASFAITQLLGPRLGASQAGLTTELGYMYVHSMEDKNVVRYQTAGVPFLGYGEKKELADANSWGYKLAGFLNYTNVFGSLEVKPNFIFSHDVDGNSPGGPFRASRKVLKLGVGVKYINSLQANLDWTSYIGEDEFDVSNDRDNLAFSIRYSF